MQHPTLLAMVYADDNTTADLGLRWRFLGNAFELQDHTCSHDAPYLMWSLRRHPSGGQRESAFAPSWRPIRRTLRARGAAKS